MTDMNEEQKTAYNVFKERRSIFLTGLAGTGKSYTLKHIVSHCKLKGLKYGITATTGSAAFLIGGTTIHSFLGIGLGNKPAKELAWYVKHKKPHVYNRLKKLDVLIIDEISMMDSELFDLISDFLKIVRDSCEPFGGLQLILCGDLFQLPPVKHGYFFKSKVFEKLDMVKIELKESQRHKEDLEFTKMLEELRWGRASEEIIRVLKNSADNKFEGDITPTMLYSRNVEVDKVNKQAYDNLISKGHRHFKYKTEYADKKAEVWSQSCKIPDSVDLCEGAQVVLTWNLSVENGLVNGARGVVKSVGMTSVTVEFMRCVKEIEFQKITQDDDINTWVKFMPLRLAYALTINKSQGMTLDCAIVFLDEFSNKDFKYGRAYTALSRVRNLNCVQVHDVDIHSFVAHPDVLEFYKSM